MLHVPAVQSCSQTRWHKSMQYRRESQVYETSRDHMVKLVIEHLNPTIASLIHELFAKSSRYKPEWGITLSVA